MKKEITGARAWKSIAEIWPSLKPPLRPSPGEIRIYERFLKQIMPLIKSRKALLFGVTPEIRDLLAKYKFHVTLFDINPEMVKATTKVLRRKPFRERVIIGHWLKTKLSKYQYDLILGDHIFSNIKFSQWDKFSQIIKSYLKPSGFVITNVHSKLETQEEVKFEQFVLYKKHPKKFKNREEKWYWMYKVMYTDPRFYRRKDYSTLWPDISQVQKLLRKTKIKMDIDEIAKMTDYIFTGSFRYTSPPYRIFEKIFKKYFKIISSDINRKHPVYQIYRIYLAQPK